MKFRKKPVVIEAIQFNSSESARRIVEWSAGAAKADTEIRNCSAENPDGFDYPCLRIDTLEGTHTASVGDWIIKGIKGELYPCKPDIFAATYEEVES